MANPNYHLRPHKTVDRNLFIEGLLRIERIIDLSDYRYIGFGSYEFDEFKLIYRRLGIEDLHSIEMDSDIFRRQGFNKPYSCIKLFNKKCETYFDEDYDENKRSIIWVDYSDANGKLSQCQDIANICSKLQENDIIRITLNASPTSISTDNSIPSDEKKKHRFAWLKDNLGEFFPEKACENDITKNGYPLFLLKMVKKAIYKDLDYELTPCPLFCYTYADQMQMMTVTLLMCSTENKEHVIEELKSAFKGWENYSRIDNWDETIRIDLPALTIHEQLEIAQYSSDPNKIEEITRRIGISEEDLKKYWMFARYFPNYQPVVL